MLDVTRRHAAALRNRRGQLERAAREAPAPTPWVPALAGDQVAVIAEVKRRSPSTGAIADRLRPDEHARAYVRGGARAVSVLTEGPHFGGSLADLEAVRRAVAAPLLRKDFILVPEQVLESRAHGASAVLMIVRALQPAQLRELSQLAAGLGMARLVEVHGPAELDLALAVEPECIGVNCRDLDTFALDRDGALALLACIPAGPLAVAESGIASREHVEEAAAHGADAVLIGTAVAAAADPQAAVRALVGVRRLVRRR